MIAMHVLIDSLRTTWKNTPHIILIVGSALVILTLFTRLWHVESLLHFELDQARDARVIDAAIQYGPGELPLQGPRAAGSFLRLGPTFYYMGYISAILFGNTPGGIVVLFALLSCAVIPLLYLFARRLFSREITLMITALASLSLFLITYSRFGWNPNTLPFFVLLLLYSLLRATDPFMNEQMRRQRGLWLVLASGALAVAGHLHFVAFVALPIVTGLFLLLTRPRLYLRHWVMAGAVFIVIQTPLIINDFLTGGENAHAFIQAVMGRSGVATSEDGDEVLEDGANDKRQAALPEKGILAATTIARLSWLTLTGDQYIDFPRIVWMSDHVDVRCDGACRAVLMRTMVAGAFFLAMVIAYSVAFWTALRRHTEKQRPLLLIGLLSGVSFALFIPIAQDIAPRFFLLIAVVPFIGFGCILQELYACRRFRFFRWIGICLFGVFFATQGLGVALYFYERMHAGTDATLTIANDTILKEKTRMTYAQQQEITSYIVARAQREQAAVFLYGQPEFKRAFWYLVEQRGVQRESLTLNTLYHSGVYVVIYRTQSDHDALLAKYRERMTIEEKRVFGTLTVFVLRPKSEYIFSETKMAEPVSRDPVFADGVQKRYLWRQVFSALRGE